MSGGGSCGCGQANCGCCEGVRALTPRAIHNRPGLGALDVRIGTHGSFLATMKARLTSHVLEPGRTRPLAGLRVRDDDAAIALLDGWASVADVLTFYQERIVNEGYLRTATEMRSVHGLAGLVGYTPRPGVAASVFLSYTLDEKATDEVIIPKGARSQAVPGPGELPQYFETSEDLAARSAWNLLGVRRTAPVVWSEDEEFERRELFLAGIATGLKPGDPLLVSVREARPLPYRVLSVAADAEADRTAIVIQPWDSASTPPGTAHITAGRRMAAIRERAPEGVTADAIGTILDELPGEMVPAAERVTRLRSAVGAIELRLAQVRGPAAILRGWAADVVAVLHEERRAIAPPERDGCPVEELIERLNTRPSAPPASATELPRSLAGAADPVGDAGLAMLAGVSPDIGNRLAAGIAGCQRASPRPPIRVAALRLRAGLYGRNFPKKRKTVTIVQGETQLQDIGEWEIIRAYRTDPVRNAAGAIATPSRLVVEQHETPETFYLDATYDGIVPGSWLFIDSSGAPKIPYFVNMAKPPVYLPQPWLVTQVQAVEPKAARADYGGSGDTTGVRILEGDSWIGFSDDEERIFAQQPAEVDRAYQIIRRTAVYAVSEELALAEVPIEREICGGGVGGEPIELDGLYLGLEPGRYVTISGERADIDDVEGVIGVEPAMIAAVAHDVRVDGNEVEPWTHAVRRASDAASTRTPMSFGIADDTLLNGTVAAGANGRQFVLGAAPMNGTATIDAVTGAFEYRPKANFSGLDEFSIQVPGVGAANIAVRVTANLVNAFSINGDSPLLSAQQRAIVFAPANLVNEAGAPRGSQGGPPAVFLHPDGNPYFRGFLQPVRREFELPGKFAGDRVHTFIWLDRPLSYCYRRASLAIHANVVKATHGESQQEILGNGDGAKPYQTFALKHAPLTWLPSPTPEGAEDTLDVYVNDIRWNGVASFTDLPPTARAYMIRTDHKGVSSVVFGDGREGARLPTGSQNVAARYRSGMGKAGNVRAGQIQQLVTRPLGVKEVVNPYRASGGADPDSVDQTRANAPLATAALGRLVATRDYADFARTFAGIGKADALELSDGRRSIVHVTVAGQDDIPIDSGSDLMAALRSAFRDLGDPFQAVVIEPRELILLVVQAKLRIDADRLWEPVVTAVRAALLAAFGFERRSLAQGVAASEIVKVIQSVDGVAMVDLDVFGGLPTTTTAAAGGRRPLKPSETAAAISKLVDDTAQQGVKSKVDARRAGRESGALRPAELVLLSPDVAATLVLNQIKEPA